jgi:hypothetical protein
MKPPRDPDTARDEDIATFTKLAAAKYDKGQAEHKNLLDETVTPEFLDEEIIDMWFYAQSLKRTLADAEEEANRWKMVANLRRVK